MKDFSDKIKQKLYTETDNCHSLWFQSQISLNNASQRKPGPEDIPWLRVTYGALIGCVHLKQMDRQRDRHINSAEELVCPWQVVCIHPDMVLHTGSLFSSFTFHPLKHPALPSSHESSSLGHLGTLAITHLSPLPEPSICPLPFSF